MSIFFYSIYNHQVVIFFINESCRTCESMWTSHVAHVNQLKNKISPTDGCIHTTIRWWFFILIDSHVRHDCPHCDRTHLYVWHDGFTCATWLVHMCDMTHSYAWHDSFMCVSWPTHTTYFAIEIQYFFWMSVCYFFLKRLYERVCVTRECVYEWVTLTQWVFLIHIHIRECECFSFIYTFANVSVTHSYTHSLIWMSECVLYIGYMNQCTHSIPLTYWNTHSYGYMNEWVRVIYSLYEGVCVLFYRMSVCSNIIWRSVFYFTVWGSYDS